MLIDYNKPVRMKNGIPIEILTTSLMGSYPVLGKSPGEYYLWRRDGLCTLDGHAPTHDLENVPEEKKVWLNIYKTMTRAHSNRREADMAACGDRVARVKITLKDFEGRFDE